MISAYRLVSNILYPFLIIFIFLRKSLGKEHKIRFKEKIFPKFCSFPKLNKEKLVWFHAASIGEVESIFPLVERLNTINKNLQILLTTVTLSSGNLVEKKLNNYQNVRHRYFPLDVNFLTKIFLDSWRPDAVFFVDSEIWPNFIFNLKKRNIPIAIINGRITTKTFKRWMIFPKSAKKIFNCFDFSITSNEETKDYLYKLGAKNIFNYGNIKFYAKINFSKNENKNEKFLKNKNFWCAVSTHLGEERLFIETHLKIKKKIKNVLTVIIPRHIVNSEKIQYECEKFKIPSQVLNFDEKIQDDKEIIIINSFGVIADYLKNSRSVFMGKSTLKKLKQEGGQNPIIAAKLGCKIYHGPYIYNFKEVYDFLDNNRISNKVENSEELSRFLINDFKYEKQDNSEIEKLINQFGQKTLNLTVEKIITTLK